MTLFGLDTNVVLRLLLDDDPGRRAAALQFGAGLGREHRVFLSLITIVELDWALRSKYGFGRKDVVLAVETLLKTRGLAVEHHSLVVAALPSVRNDNADLADALIACRALAEGCASVKTFDIKAAKRIPGMELLA